MGAGLFFDQPMKNTLYFLLMAAIAANAAAQTTTYTEQGGAVIVVNTATGEFLVESSAPQFTGVQCKRTDSGA